MRKISIVASAGILLSIGATLSHAQTKFGKSTKQVPSAAASRKSDVLDPTATVEHYLAGAFSGSIDALGSHFWGNDPEAVITAISRSDATKPKAEFETTAEYETRINDARTANRRRIVFVFQDYSSLVVGAQFSYDADNSTMTAELNLARARFLEGSGFTSYYTTDFTNIVRSRSEYVGTNAFGAKTTITKTFIERYGIVFSLPAWFRQSGTGLSDLSLTFPLGVAQARDLKPNLRIGVICRVEDGKTMHTTDGSKPTFSEPYDTTIDKHYLVALPELLVIFDERTGGVLKTATWGPIGPVLKVRVEPKYPDVARLAKVEGTVKLRATIDKTGAVTNVVYISGPVLLSSSATIATVKQWSYEAATLNGTPVEADIQIELPFQLGR